MIGFDLDKTVSEQNIDEETVVTFKFTVDIRKDDVYIIKTEEE